MLRSIPGGSELDHQYHLHHYYQQLALSNHCQELHHFLKPEEQPYHHLPGAESSPPFFAGDHHQDQQQRANLNGLALEPTSVLDLWSPSPSSKGGCSGLSSSGAARLQATAAAAAAAGHGSPSSFDDERSNSSEKSVEAARKFFDPDEEENRRKSAKNTVVVSSKLAVGGGGYGYEDEQAAAARRRSRDKSLDEWLADLQQHKARASEDEELLLLHNIQSSAASSSSNSRREIDAEAFVPGAAAISQDPGQQQQQFGMEELESMLLSPSSASHQHQHQQLARWLLSDQHDYHLSGIAPKEVGHHLFPASDHSCFNSSQSFFALAPSRPPDPPPPPSAHFDAAAFAASRHLPLPPILQPTLFAPPRLLPQHEVSLEQLLQASAPPGFANSAMGAAQQGHLQAQAQAQEQGSLAWELDRNKRKLDHCKNNPNPYLPPAASSSFAVPLVASGDSRPSSWQQQQQQDDDPPNPKLQRLHGGARQQQQQQIAISANLPSSNPALPAATAAAGSSSALAAASAIPSVISVPDEGLGLMDQLLHLAQAIDVGSNHVAQSILARLNQHLFSHQGKRIQRLAFYFKEALAARMAIQSSQQDHHHHHHHQSATSTSISSSRSSTPGEILARARAYTSFCEISPLLRFAYLSANQAIADAIQAEGGGGGGGGGIHIVDYDPGFGSQWASLLQDLERTPASQPQPRLRLTLAGPDPAHLAFVADGIRDFARDLHLRHLPEVRVVRCSDPAQLTPSALRLADGEALVFNFMCSLHRSLAGDGDGGGGGVDAALTAVMTASPRLVTLAEQEVDDSDGKFQRRFVETLQYYAFVLDSLGPDDGAGILTVEREILAPAIANAVSCEGDARTERHERLAQWRLRMARAGLQPVPMPESARMQAECLAKRHSHGKNFDISREEGGLLLGWQGKPLVAVSSWTPACPAASSSAKVAAAINGRSSSNNIINNNKC